MLSALAKGRMRCEVVAFAPPAPADALRRCLLAVRTADSLQSGRDHATASFRARAVAIVAPSREVTRSLGTVFVALLYPRVRLATFHKCCVSSQGTAGMPTSGPPGKEPVWAADRAAVRLFVAARGSVAVAAEAVPNTAAGRGVAVFQAVPAVSEDQSGGRIPTRTSSRKIWQCLGSVWQCLAVLNPSQYFQTSSPVPCANNTGRAHVDTTYRVYLAGYARKALPFTSERNRYTCLDTLVVVRV